MKKIICTFMAFALLLTGCGQNISYVPEEVGIATATQPTTEEVSTKKKRQDSTAIVTDIPETTTVSTVSTSSGKTTVTSTDKISETTTENTGTNQTTEQTTKTTTESYYLDGVVYEVYDDSILINETDLKKVKVSVADSSEIKDIQIGDVVEIAYNGLIDDGYISYAYDAYSVEVTKKADKKYEFQKFECNGMSFSMLVPENWSNKAIEYPQDNDFTDWGIRFIPNGESMGIDISWHSSIQLQSSLGSRPKTVSGLNVTEYTQSGVWRFITFENNYIISNNLFDSEEYSNYVDEIDFIINTIEFN
ncbi:MAG: hypothetical protein K2K91_05140 [Ruminococcus sp.]|nr:hypothetical protein [Ruminococcus sp.]MDE7097738.1 hypothetical protein [Ruminococcus sp.]